MDFDVLHYYTKFINNKFTFLRENIKECSMFLDNIFLKTDASFILKVILDSNLLLGGCSNTFLDSAFQKVGELNYIKVLSSYDLDLTFNSESFIYTFNNIDRNFD